MRALLAVLELLEVTDPLATPLTLAAVLAWHHPPSMMAGVPLAPLRWLAVSVLLGLLFGWLFMSLTRDRGDPREFVLFVPGLALLAAGAQAFFSVSALFGSAAADLFLATVVLGMAVSEMTGPPLIRRLLVAAGDVGAVGEEAARRVQRADRARHAPDVEGAGDEG